MVGEETCCCLLAGSKLKVVVMRWSLVGICEIWPRLFLIGVDRYK